MEELLKRNFTRAYAVVCSLVFIVICLRAYFIPFSHDEASTFFFYIQSDNYLPYKAHVYTNNHVLNSALANICYHLGGSHRFVLRIPNLLAFVVLCFGVFNFFRHFSKTASKVILTCFFILTFNFLDFFELCRGYGLSLAFMVAGLSHLQDYFTGKQFKQLAWFSLFWQLALAANLTLIVAFIILLVLIFIFQARNKLFLTLRNGILQLANLGILAFWIKFSLFYKKKGMLDSGIGEDYWQVSFKSLMLFIFGTDALWMQVLLLSLFVVMLLAGLAWFFKRRLSPDALFSPRLLYLFVLCGLVAAFYLQKKLLGVNYPEDRTGLFFYVFFALSLAFFFDTLHSYLTSVAAASFLVSSLGYFYLSFNLSSFTHYFYHVIPKEIYAYLEEEHKKSKQMFTIGGHTNREMNFTFMNYRGQSLLNPMDDPRQMFMNCDYYFALMAEKPFYRFFYDEVAYDARWHRVLLKRKQPIKRIEITKLTRGPKYCKGSDEFYEFLRFQDSIITARNCLEADIEFDFKKVPAPFHTFVVMQVNDENNNILYYKKIPLFWIAKDLSGQNRRFKMTTGPLPEKFGDVIIYLWNIDREEAEFEMKQLKILELQAPGINVVIPKNYYPYVKRLLKEELL
jgi:hypothetical protein